MAAARDAWSLDSDRTFEQDPRFGLIVLSEIASRALSPAVNDPGTAIHVLASGLKAFTAYLQPYAPNPAVKYPRIQIVPIVFAEMLEDFFVPIARDGAGQVEVQIRLQKTLKSLAAIGGKRVENACQLQSASAMARAMQALASPDDRRRLEAVCQDTTL